MRLTPQEHRAIVAAWRSLLHYAQVRGRMGEQRELDKILSEARREMSGDQTEAKAVLLSHVADHMTAHNREHDELWNKPRPVRDILAYAWHANRRNGVTDPEWMEAYEHARNAQRIRLEARVREGRITQAELLEMQA